MKQIKLKTKVRHILADTITPVSIYLRLRDIFPYSILLESSDYHGDENSYSFICLNPIASFSVEKGTLRVKYSEEQILEKRILNEVNITEELSRFIKQFHIEDQNINIKANGIFGYTAYDAVKYFENIHLKDSGNEAFSIPEIHYSLYRYIIGINHFQNSLFILENYTGGEQSKLDYIESLLYNRTFATYPFVPYEKESSNINDNEYMEMVSKGKYHCHRGDVFQIVLSRQFRQMFTGDEFNVYRCLRSINPSPYLFYFDFGDYKIFGSSPEALLEIKSARAYIHPIAGTFPRTGNDEKDKQLAGELTKDKKENAEHTMLVDLARNDLSRNAKNVNVETFKEIQYYSHVIHMVSKVTGQLPENYNSVKVFADSFPAGTLSGAPKYRAMELIDKYENQNRGYYGGGIGYYDFNGDVNHAIMIRSFLSKNNTLFYQAGAGIVADSVEKKELQEVNNKLMALKKAITMAKDI